MTIGGFELSIVQLCLVGFAAILLGFSKTGLSAAMLLAVPLFANAFGGMNSTGIVLPMLLIGDIFAISYYRRHAEWRSIRMVMPWNVVGLIYGTIVGNMVDDQQFKMLIAGSVILCLILLFYLEKRGKKVIKENMVLAIFVGILCGFTSMIGNAAGPIFSVYLLARGYQKNDFMGTASVFFFINNLIKLPLQIYFWHNITWNSALVSVSMLPLIAIGAVLGAYVIKKIKDHTFRYVILGMTAIAAVRLLG